METLQEMGSPIPVICIGWPDQFIEHGKIDDLRAKYGISVDEAQAQVMHLLTHRKQPSLIPG
jgi:1-deoxy-D-xylulose-5-phosphate synthase